MGEQRQMQSPVCSGKLSHLHVRVCVCSVLFYVQLGYRAAGSHKCAHSHRAWRHVHAHKELEHTCTLTQSWNIRARSHKAGTEANAHKQQRRTRVAKHEWTWKQPKTQEPFVHSVSHLHTLACLFWLVFLLIRSVGPDRTKTQGPAMKSGHCPCTSENPCNPLQVQINVLLALQFHIWFSYSI